MFLEVDVIVRLYFLKARTVAIMVWIKLRIAYQT